MRNQAVDGNPTLWPEEPNDEPQNTTVEDEYNCICGGKDLDLWIRCDNPDCKIKWYHAECVGIEEGYAGEWLCPSCEPVAPPPPPPPPGMMAKQHVRTASSVAEPSNAAKVKASVTKKKGIAKKKPTGKTSAAGQKPGWKGWMELASDEDVLGSAAAEQQQQTVSSQRAIRKTKRDGVRNAQAAAARYSV